MLKKLSVFKATALVAITLSTVSPLALSAMNGRGSNRNEHRSNSNPNLEQIPKVTTITCTQCRRVAKSSENKTICADCIYANTLNEGISTELKKLEGIRKWLLPAAIAAIILFFFRQS